jgi:hypothetical protein
MGAPFTSDALIGVNLTGVDSSASPQFGPLTRVKVYDTTITGGVREAIYVKTDQVVTVSSNLILLAGALVSVTAGGLVGMNATTTVKGDWIWARTSSPGIA